MKDDDPAKIEEKVEQLRDHLGGIAGELDRRRHEAFDLKLQLRRHGTAIGLTAVAMLAVVGGSIAVGAWTHARRQRLMSKAHRLRAALARAIAHPDDVARTSPSVGKKALSAILSATAAVLARTAAQRLVARPRPMAN
jgi:hypothetical protein